MKCAKGAKKISPGLADAIGLRRETVPQIILPRPWERDLRHLGNDERSLAEPKARKGRASRRGRVIGWHEVTGEGCRRPDEVRRTRAGGEESRSGLFVIGRPRPQSRPKLFSLGFALSTSACVRCSPERRTPIRRVQPGENGLDRISRINRMWFHPTSISRLPLSTFNAQLSTCSQPSTLNQYYHQPSRR